MDQSEEFVAREKVRSETITERRIVVRKPGSAIAVVVDGDSIFRRNRCPNDAQRDGNRCGAPTRLERRRRLVRARAGIRRHPDVYPEGLRGLMRYPIVGFRHRRPVWGLNGDQRIGIETLRRRQKVKPLAEQVGLQAALRREALHFGGRTRRLPAGWRSGGRRRMLHARSQARSGALGRRLSPGRLRRCRRRIRAQMLRQTHEVSTRASQRRCQYDCDTEFHAKPPASFHLPVGKHYLTAGD